MIGERLGPPQNSLTPMDFIQSFPVDFVRINWSDCSRKCTETDFSISNYEWDLCGVPSIFFLELKPLCYREIPPRYTRSQNRNGESLFICNNVRCSPIYIILVKISPAYVKQQPSDGYLLKLKRFKEYSKTEYQETRR